MVSNLRVGTADNDVNALRSMGMLPNSYALMTYNRQNAFFIMTDTPRGFLHFERVPLSTQMEADFDTGNMRFKARERYSFGFSDQGVCLVLQAHKVLLHRTEPLRLRFFSCIIFYNSLTASC